MICLIILIILSCQSTNTYYVENNGAKLELGNKRGSYIDSIDNRGYDRANNNYKENEQEEVKTMESGLQELMTAISSAIAGVYCLVKTIINIVKKVKN